MNTLFTAFFYFGLASLTLFLIAIVIQAIRRPRKIDQERSSKSPQDKSKHGPGESYNHQR